MLSDSPVVALLPCVDMERAREFYGETLGLEEVEMPGASGEGAPSTVTFQCGQGTQIALYQRPEPTKADHTAAGWAVEDVGAVVDELIERGVEMEVYDMPSVEFDERGVATAGGMKGAWFKDPEGNILAIRQMS